MEELAKIVPRDPQKDPKRARITPCWCGTRRRDRMPLKPSQWVFPKNFRCFPSGHGPKLERHPLRAAFLWHLQIRFGLRSTRLVLASRSMTCSLLITEFECLVGLDRSDARIKGRQNEPRWITQIEGTEAGTKRRFGWALAAALLPCGGFWAHCKKAA